MEQAQLDELLKYCVILARQAGDAILPFWQTNLAVRHKIDRTPVTIADETAHAILVKGLEVMTPDWPILSEEGEIVCFDQRKRWCYYWLLDPIDGTRAFIRGSDEFTINIALIENHKPILGVIYAPAQKICYYAHHKDIACKQKNNEVPIVLSSTHPFTPPWQIAIGQSYREQHFETKIPKNWSYSWLRLNSSLKFCALAEVRADIYMGFGLTCEWDTGAGQCILQQVGGMTVDLFGNSLQYNTKSSLLNPRFIAIVHSEYLDQWLNLLKKEDNNE